jgi:DNA-binding transcriptional MerR regulator
LPQHVLRFWETRFSHIRPLKRGGGRRYYRPEDVELLRAIRFLLYDEGLTIKGVQKMLREQGAQAVRGEQRASGPYPEPEAASEASPTIDFSELREALENLREAERLLVSARRR